MTGTASVDGLCPELLTALALRRALGRGVAKAGEIYVDDGHPMGCYLTGTFTELIDCGLLELADDDGWVYGGSRSPTPGRFGMRKFVASCDGIPDEYARLRSTSPDMGHLGGGSPW